MGILYFSHTGPVVMSRVTPGDVEAFVAIVVTLLIIELLLLFYMHMISRFKRSMIH
jgi:hypothetical protein